MQANVEECGPCPVFASFTLAFALQLRKKHGETSVMVRKTSVMVRKTSVTVRKTSVRLRKTSVRVRITSVRLRKTSVRISKTSVRVRKTSVRVRKTSVTVQYTYYQKHTHVTKPSQTHTLQTPPPHTHTIQNNIKLPQYKLKQYEAQHVSGDTSPIIRSLKQHWQLLVFHTLKVVGRVVGGRCQAQCAWQLPLTTRPTTFHIWKTRGCQCSFRLLMMGGVSPETCRALYKYGIIKFWYIAASCWIFFMNYKL